MDPMLVKVLLDRLPSCTRAPRTLGKALPVKEWDDDAETWGKTTTRTRGLARREESPTGGANRVLVGGEGPVAAYHSIGEKQRKGVSFSQPVAFIP
jgi:hypothetical protein